MAGKGDSYRPVDRRKWENNFDRVFGTNCDVYKCGNPDLCPKCQAALDSQIRGLPTPDQVTRTEELIPINAPLQEFQKFPKIHRLYRPIIITEKIDGTNGQVFVPEDPSLPLWAGSRKRWITPENDNYGFAAWVRDHEDELRQLGPGHHYGEWWGKGVNRGYGLDHRRFSLFNVSRWADWLPWPSWLGSEPRFEKDEDRQLAPNDCCVVPILYAGRFCEGVIRGAVLNLRDHGSAAVPGYMKPEGIVIFHRQSGHLFKVTLENDEAPKGKQNG